MKRVRVAVALVCAYTREAVPLFVIMSLKAPPPANLNPLYPLIPRQTFTYRHQLPSTNISKFRAVELRARGTAFYLPLLTSARRER